MENNIQQTKRKEKCLEKFRRYFEENKESLQKMACELYKTLVNEEKKILIVVINRGIWHTFYREHGKPQQPSP